LNREERAVVYCQNCGRKIARTALFCVHCGAKVAVDATAMNQVSASTDAPLSTAPFTLSGIGGLAKATIQAKIIAAAVCAGVVAAGIILYNTYFVVSPEKVVQKFVNSINSRDYNTAIACLDPKDEKAYNAISNIMGGLLHVSLKDLADLMPFVKPNGNDEVKYEDFHILSESVNGDQAKVFTSQIGGFGGNTSKVSKEVFILQRFDDVGWRIVDIQESD
jgi:limonene-1,2-epoxide hydrolase